MKRQIPIQRDISPELKRRLKAVDARIADARAILSDAEEERGLIVKLLDLEERRAGKPTQSQKRELRDITNAMLLEGDTTRSAIVNAAEKEGHKAPARGINAILMGYARLKHVNRIGKEGYSLTAKGREALSQKTEGSQ